MAKVAAIQDDFTALDTAVKWEVPGGTGAGTVSIDTGKLDLVASGLAGSWASLLSRATYELDESEVYFRMIRPMTGAVDADGWRSILRLWKASDPSTRFEWFLQSNDTLCTRVVEGWALIDNTVVWDESWSTTTDFLWLKIRKIGNRVTWWTAPEVAGAPGEWTERAFYDTTFTFEDVHVEFLLDCWDGAPGAVVQSAQFDNLNVGEVVEPPVESGHTQSRIALGFGLGI